VDTIGIFLYSITVICVLIASILHSFKRRGAEFSINFFFFAFILVFPRLGVHSFRNEMFTGFNPAAALFLGILYASLWVGVIYASLALSEKILSVRFPRNDGRLLPLVIVFGGVFMGLSRMIEESLAGSGILRAPSYFTHPDGAAYHWAALSMLFLFCIIAGYRTSVRRYESRFLMFFLPFVYVWTPLFSGGEISPGVMANIIWALTLVSLILFSPLLIIRYKENYPADLRRTGYLPGLLIIILSSSFTLLNILSGRGEPAGYFIIPPLFFLVASGEKIRFSYLICIYLIAVYLSLASPVLLSSGMLILLLLKLLETRASG